MRYIKLQHLLDQPKKFPWLKNLIIECIKWAKEDNENKLVEDFELAQFIKHINPPTTASEYIKKHANSHNGSYPALSGERLTELLQLLAAGTILNDAVFEEAELDEKLYPRTGIDQITQEQVKNDDDIPQQPKEKLVKKPTLDDIKSKLAANKNKRNIEEMNRQELFDYAKEHNIDIGRSYSFTDEGLRNQIKALVGEKTTSRQFIFENQSTEFKRGAFDYQPNATLRNDYKYPVEYIKGWDWARRNKDLDNLSSWSVAFKAGYDRWPLRIKKCHTNQLQAEYDAGWNWHKNQEIKEPFQPWFDKKSDDFKMGYNDYNDNHVPATNIDILPGDYKDGRDYAEDCKIASEQHP